MITDYRINKKKLNITIPVDQKFKIQKLRDYIVTQKLIEIEYPEIKNYFSDFYWNRKKFKKY